MAGNQLGKTYIGAAEAAFKRLPPSEFRAQAFQLAVSKARELGWIV